MALASFRDFRYWYPGAEQPALAGASLEIEAGLTLVAGPSGGGKSTFLRAFNGLVPHFHGGRVGGSAVVAGQDVLSTPTRRLARSVGFVFQNPESQSVYGSVERDVAFALENAGLPPAEMAGRVEAALKATGALGLRTRRVTTLSGGERQRVALAGAIALQPRLVLLDEPASQLDEEGAQALVAACLELRDRGTAVVVAEHRIDLLLGAADRRLTVREGAVRAGIEPPPRAAARHGSSATGAVAWRLDKVTAGIGAPVLEDLELCGGEGEVVAVTGSNGSGKTTLLRTLAGLLKPISGSVLRPRGRTAYLPQDPAAMLHRPTVREEVALTLRSGGGGEAEPYLAEMGLLEVAGRYPRDLSGGERQRTAIAAVAAGRPALALLDEPTRGMDAEARGRLIAVIDRLAAGGAAVVLATHDTELAAAAADRVVELGR